MPPSTQSCAEMRTDIGSCCGQTARTAREHFERIAQAVGQAAAVVVAAAVGQRRDEARQQVAVRAVQFEPVEAGLGGVARRAHEVGASRDPCRRGHRLRNRAAVVEVGHAARRRSAASCRSASGWSAPAPSQGSLVEPLAPAWPICIAILASVSRCTKSTMRFQASRLRLVPQARAARRDARVGRRAGHLGHHHAGAAQRARAQVHEVEVAGHAVDAAVLRHRRDDDAVLQRDASARV